MLIKCNISQNRPETRNLTCLSFLCMFMSSFLMEFYIPSAVGGWVHVLWKHRIVNFHPPTHPTGEDGCQMHTNQNGKRNHVGRATQIPQSGRTVPSIPHFCEGKICDEWIIGFLLVICFAVWCFWFLAVMFLKRTFWRRRIQGNTNMNIRFFCNVLCVYVLTVYVALWLDRM